MFTAPGERGDLAQFLAARGRALTAAQAAKFIIRPLVAALSHLHAHGCIHRDIKPENLLIAKDGTVMLSDFDLAIDASSDAPSSRVRPSLFKLVKAKLRRRARLYVVSVPQTRVQSSCLPYLHLSSASFPYRARSTVLAWSPGAAALTAEFIQVGTPDYIAPEVLQSTSAASSGGPRRYGCKVDVWAVGVLTWEVLQGRAPFTAKTTDDIKKNVLAGGEEVPAIWPPACQDFVRLCMRRDAEKRASAEQLLAHEWLQSVI